MANLFENALGDTLAAAKSAAGVSVTYTSAVDAVDLVAVPGQTTFDVADGDGRVTELTTRDWIIAANDLVLAGLHATPSPGDTIEHLDGSTVRTFRVLEPGGEQCYRLGPHGQTMRIHTKETTPGT